MLSLWGWVYRERRSRCWSPAYPLFILSFDSLHIERPQHLKASVWVHFPHLICTTEWLQLTQRTNPGRSRDWPKRTESFGFVSQWDWTFIRYIELVLARLNFYMKQHSTRYGYIQTDTCPIRDCLKVASTIGVRCTMASDRECPKCLVGISLFSIAITPFWEFCAETRYVSEKWWFAVLMSHGSPSNTCFSFILSRVDPCWQSLSSISGFPFLRRNWMMSCARDIAGIWIYGNYFHFIADISDDRNCTWQLITTIILLWYASLDV